MLVGYTIFGKLSIISCTSDDWFPFEPCELGRLTLFEVHASQTCLCKALVRKGRNKFADAILTSEITQSYTCLQRLHNVD